MFEENGEGMKGQGSVISQQLVGWLVGWLAFLSPNPGVHPVLGGKVACANIFLDVGMLSCMCIQMQCYPPLSYIQMQCLPTTVVDTHAVLPTAVIHTQALSYIQMQCYLPLSYIQMRCYPPLSYIHM